MKFKILLLLCLSIATGILPRNLASNGMIKNLLQNRSLPCTFTGPVAEFCNLNVRDQVCVGGNLTVGGTIIGAQQGFGNTLFG